MINDQDQYEAFYSDKLWNLLPAVYRMLDTDQFSTAGPLRELVNRIGVQAAIVRRSVDRMWDDQSIETCDDWVIPYLGDLLVTNLVSNIDARTTRRDVAKTIYFRRRKGTLGALEEIAFDITGWNARVVEFSRRLARTRHGLDPAIGLPSIAEPGVSQLQQAESLRGPFSHTGIGGLADLRKVTGTSRIGTAFDEFFHTADFRQGQGSIGRYSIPRLGIFLWRLQSFGVGPTTPVESSLCPGHYTFDPTGRDIPLFAAARPGLSGNWVSPQAWQLPGPLTPPLLQPALEAPTPTFYAENATQLNSLGVFQVNSGSNALSLVPSSLITVNPITIAASYASAPPRQLFINPSSGRLIVLPHAPQGKLQLTYHYGFSSTIGAGPYNRQVGGPTIPGPATQFPPLTGGGLALNAPNAIPKTGTATINDSLTYTAFPASTVFGAVTLRAGLGQRPVVRIAPPGLITFQGDPTSDGNCLALDGLFFSGTDLVLSGKFDCVTINCCTLDPGSSASGPDLSGHFSAPNSLFAQSIDGRDLVPCRLWIEGQVTTLTISRSLTGTVRTRNGGRVETLTVSDSILQSIPTITPGLLRTQDVQDPQALEDQLRSPLNPLATYLRSLSPKLQSLLSGPGSASIPFSSPFLHSIVDALNDLLSGPLIYNPLAFQGVLLSSTTLQLLHGPGASFSVPMTRLNRLLLDDGFPRELADAALCLSDGDASLSRCTVLGRLVVHRLQASNCILSGLSQTDDTQHGCVRFTAWVTGSLLPRQYESPQIPQGACLFASTDFGRPDYAQLLPTVDNVIVSNLPKETSVPSTILAGAENGSEIGAFSRDLNPVKMGGLLLKYQESMPVGLDPVLITVT